MSHYDIEIESLTKHYGPIAVLRDVSLQVRPGEVLALLGPSGCGKTTTLRVVAGFVAPDAGRVRIRGRDVTRTPAYQRNTGMVFQNYALFPHLTVRDNVAFGLSLRRLPPAEIERRVAEALRLVRLGGLEKRYPSQLSGGQQQRVALARALAIQPVALLLDEPLSNLDAKLRREMRVEIRELQTSLGITTIFVTHDQEEALSIADRVAVMNRGEVEQVGTPQEVFERPASVFVADFMRVDNIIHGTIEDGGGPHTFRADAGFVVEIDVDRASLSGRGTPVALAVRPERIRLFFRGEHPDGVGRNVFPCVIDYMSYQGVTRQYGVTLRPWDVRLTVVQGAFAGAPAHERGAEAAVGWEPGAALLLAR